MALVEFVEGDQVHLVRAYDGKHIVDPIDQVHGVMPDIANVLNRTPSSKLYKKRVLEGKDSSFMPLGDTKPALSLGLGAPDLTTFAEVSMVEHMREKEPVVQLDVPISKTEAAGRNAMTRNEIEAQDVLDDITQYNALDGAFEIEYPTSSSKAVGGGGGMAMFLIAGIVIYVSMYGK